MRDRYINVNHEPPDSLLKFMFWFYIILGFIGIWSIYYE